MWSSVFTAESRRGQIAVWTSELGPEQMTIAGPSPPVSLVESACLVGHESLETRRSCALCLLLWSRAGQG